MNWVKSWFHASQTQTTNHEHKHSDITHYCCSDICSKSRQICSSCSSDHPGHHYIRIQEYKKSKQMAELQIKIRNKIEQQLEKYNNNLLDQFKIILDKETANLISEINNKVYNADLVQIFKKHLDGKRYDSLLINLKPSQADQLCTLIQSTIKNKQAQSIQQFKEFVHQKILVNQQILTDIIKVYRNPDQTMKQKVTALMPFKCVLQPIFLASKHLFQTERLHKLGLKGPIVIVAQTSKGKVFGGFTPKMFPKNQHYEEDNRCRSFLFSLDKFVRLPIKEEYKKYAIKGGNNLWFGRGDLVIADECHKGNISWASVGRAYQTPPGLNGNPDEWLAGSLYFQIVEYEIFEVKLL